MAFVDTWVTKKNVLLLGGACVALLAFLWFLGSSDYCYHDRTCESFFQGSLYAVIFNPLLFAPFILLFSLITFLLNDSIFKLWRNFSLVWFPIYIVLAMIVPGDNGSNGWIMSTPSSRDKVLIIGFLLYVLLSLFLILTKSIQVYWKK